jgi:hypothetical protein
VPGAPVRSGAPGQVGSGSGNFVPFGCCEFHRILPFRSSFSKTRMRGRCAPGGARAQPAKPGARGCTRRPRDPCGADRGCGTSTFPVGRLLFGWRRTPFALDSAYAPSPQNIADAHTGAAAAVSGAGAHGNGPTSAHGS